MNKIFLICLIFIIAVSSSYAEPTMVPIGKTVQEQTSRSSIPKNPPTSPVLMQNIDNNANAIDLGPYMRKLQRTIRYNWDPPQSGMSKRVVTTFTIAKNGSLLNCAVKESSGDKRTDEAAIAAIKKSFPFDPLPSDLKRNSIEIKYMFDYNVSSATRTK